MKSIVLFFLVSLILPLFDNADSNISSADEVSIELINSENLDFLFSVEYKKIRNQIHVRSDEPLRSLRLIDGSRNKKSYKSIGSNLVILPMTDFTAGDSHFIEVKFIEVEAVVMAKVIVPELVPEKIH